MAGVVSLELDPIFLKALGYLHSKSKDSAEKLKALLDDSLARGSDSTYRTLQKEIEVSKLQGSKIAVKQDAKASSSSSSKVSSSEKSKKEAEKRPSEKVRMPDMLDIADPPKKLRTEKSLENRSSPITVPASKEISLPDLSGLDETSADIFAMEMGLACVVCRQMTVTSGNQLVECQECHNLYHQDCHKPQVTDKDVNDPRLVWYCARCTKQMKRMAQKTQKPPQKPSPTLTSSIAPVVKDSLVKKPEMKPKVETTNTFQAFKRTEVKASVTASSIAASGGPLQASGLTGWAAFTKSSTAGPSGTKLGSSPQGASGKSTPPTTGTKPAGLSVMANPKSGLGTKMSGSPGASNNGNNGSNTGTLKTPPPLTLGKQVLSRSSSGDSLGVVTVTGSSSTATSPGASSSTPIGGLGGNGGSGGNGGGNGGSNNGAKLVSVDGKTHTSQESQLQAMRRLQMVKKKAAQKKLKK